MSSSDEPRPEADSAKSEYHAYIFRKVMYITVLLVAVIVCAGYSITLGGRDIGFFEVYGLIFDHLMGATYELATPEWWDDFIVWHNIEMSVP